MLEVNVIKLEYAGQICYNKNCKRLPEYHWNVIGDVWNIKQGAICAVISTGPLSAVIYCNDCIDDIFKMIKSKLDRKLWTFK